MADDYIALQGPVHMFNFDVRKEEICQNDAPLVLVLQPLDWKSLCKIMMKTAEQ